MYFVCWCWAKNFIPIWFLEGFLPRDAFGWIMSSPPVVTSFPLNPLTETFTPPSDCNGVYLSTVFMLGPSKTCLPPNAGLKETEYFSPGLICPTGYASACHDTLGVSSITTVTCCPTSGDITLSCAPTIRKDIWSTLFCTWDPEPGKPTAVFATLSSDKRTSSSLVPFTSPEGINAFGVRMVYESSDLITSTSSSSSSTQTSGSDTSTPSNTSVPQSSSSSQVPTGTSAPGNSGLSTGAKAAIGIVIPLVVLAIFGAFFFWWRRKKQYRVAPGSPVAPVGLTEYYQAKPQLNEVSGETRRSELAGEYTPVRHDEPSELPDNHRPWDDNERNRCI